MLTSLYVKNVAVVKELNLDFNGGFSVLTGETGAGKSVIMDCLGILIGSRPVKGKIRNGEREAIIRACFSDPSGKACALLSEYGYECGDEIMLQRNFNADGRSTVRINGQTVTQGIAKDIGAHLIDIHGQHDNQRLMRRSEHIDILDSYADLYDIKEEYRVLYSEYRSMQSKLSELKERSREKERLIDVYRFQAKEIDDAALRTGEEEKLLLEEKRLENIEKIQKHTRFTYHALRGSERSAAVLIDKASASLSLLDGIIPEARDLNERLIQIRYEIEDAADTISSWECDDAGDADKKLDKIGSRLNLISRLKKKYGSSVDEIIKFRSELGERLDEMENSDANIEVCERELNVLKERLIDKAKSLSHGRHECALRLQKDISEELAFLEMPRARFVIDIKPLDEPDMNGIDDIEFLISANSGQEPMPMIKIASGGEMSRIMLAIKSILLDKEGTETVIFDEIDTGISGKTSRKVGIKLKKISKCTQVICVTHSAQIASLADNHYLISKRESDGATETVLSVLDGEERVRELARILGGLNVTENQMKAAYEMIDEGKEL